MKINKIYKIVSHGQVVYVGKTNQELSERFYQHKADKNHPDKQTFLNDPENECYIEELYRSEFKYDIAEWEQFYIDEFKNDSLIWFNRMRAKKMSQLDKRMTIQILKKTNNTNEGTFDTGDLDDDWLGNA
jgi:hypothetical protein